TLSSTGTGWRSKGSFFASNSNLEFKTHKIPRALALAPQKRKQGKGFNACNTREPEVKRKKTEKALSTKGKAPQTSRTEQNEDKSWADSMEHKIMSALEDY
ncbi:1042_t:CDS:2, partial [Gigaspora rosea]